MQKLYYTNPAKEWLEGLPIGNGRLAAMVWGDKITDTLTLNHEWLWRGKNRDRKVIPNSDKLDEVRSALKAGHYFRAGMLANLYFAGEGGISPFKNRTDPYQVAGTMEWIFSDCTEFEWRELDITNGIAKTLRKTANGDVVSEFFASCINPLLLSKWQGQSPFSGTLVLSRTEDKDAEYSYAVRGNQVLFDCKFDGGINYSVICDVRSDGQLTELENGFRIENATFVECITNIATSVFNMEEEVAKYATSVIDYDDEKRRHTAEFTRIMNSVQLELAEDESLDNLPVEKRLERIRKGEQDNGITRLYFDFGRYLMLSSSIKGDLPANLQGKWNDSINPPWECDYHFDINLQMNYWMAEPCNMANCAEALLKYIESFHDSGREAARGLYGCRGICLPIQTDAWGISTPEAFGWASWIGAAPWIAQNFWHHYTYTGDRVYLASRGYPYLKAVAEFYEDYLVKDEEGIFQIMPSQSPENLFNEAGGQLGVIMPVSICISAAMDVQLAYDALSYAVEAANVLEVDKAQAERWKHMRNNLPEFKIGPDGRLLEWNEPFTEREPGHRHLSHLYGVYPSQLFTALTRPEQFEAAKKSLAYRLSHGGGHTGWSRAWVSCLQARFGDAEGFYEHFIALIRDFATITMLDLHPPGIFQIDGNLGAVAALIEAVVSYTDGKVHLLRSLPKEWPDGSLSGIKVPGGHTISVVWKNGKLQQLKIVMGFSEKLTVSNLSIGDKILVGSSGQELVWCDSQ